MPPPPHALQLIVDDHKALAGAIRAMRQAVDASRHARRPPDFPALRALLAWLDDVPARMHHAHESTLLFPLIRARCPALRPVLDRLEGEHGRGERSVRELAQALGAWQAKGESRRESFELQLRIYADSYLGHMEVEENYVLPVAMDYLSAADWRALAEAFGRQAMAPARPK